MDAYAELAADRKKCARCGERMTNPSELSGGKYDTDEIGPWSLWLGDRKARIMIIGKDWGPDDYFLKENKTKPIGRDDPNNTTNKRLIELIGLLGIEVSDCSQGQNTKAGVFLTNSVLCLKNAKTTGAKNAKSMSAPVPKVCFEQCQSFLSRTIEIIDPDYIISPGVDAFKAVLAASNQSLRPYKGPLRGTVESRSKI